MIALDLDKLRSDIKSDEGFSEYAYGDQFGFLTIGYGRLVDRRKGSGITEFEAEFLLQNDIDKVIRETVEKFPWVKNLSEVRQRAIFNMVYQLGLSGFSKFKKTIEHLEAGRFNQAASECLESNWASQTPQRAKKIAAMIKEGKDG